ncbi:MAG: hypothetical protein AAFR79_14650, partial [Pseudomonadota bacterium]
NPKNILYASLKGQNLSVAQHRSHLSSHTPYKQSENTTRSACPDGSFCPQASHNELVGKLARKTWPQAYSKANTLPKSFSRGQGLETTG